MPPRSFFGTPSRIKTGRWLCFLLGVLAIAGSRFSLGLLLGPIAVWLGFQVSDEKVRPWRKLGLIGLVAGGYGFTTSLILPASVSDFPGSDLWVGKPAPAFDWIDIDGNTHTLEAYLGRRLFVVFWGMNCNPCLQEIPSLRKLVETLPGEEFAILSVTSNPGAWLEKGREKLAINYPIVSLANPQNHTPSPYRDVSVIPTLMVISPEGNFEHLVVGRSSEEELLSLAKGAT